MLTLVRWTHGLLKAIVSDAAPWQIGLATGLGWSCGCLPWLLWPGGINWLAIAVFALLFCINCHLGMGLLAMSIAAVVHLMLSPVLASFAPSLLDLANLAAGNDIMRLLGLHHTSQLTGIALALISAPIAGFCMAKISHFFQQKLRAKLAERRRLRKAGKTAGNTIFFNLACWFLGLTKNVRRDIFAGSVDLWKAPKLRCHSRCAEKV